MLSVNFPFVLGIEVGEVVLICDNAPCHSTVDKLEEDFPGLTVQRLLPFSLMFNPVENIWCEMKSYIKRHMRMPVVARPGVGNSMWNKTLTMQWRP